MSNDINKICDRLLDSEEHAVESAIPHVAEWRDEAVRTREAALALMEALEWMISNEPEDSLKRGVLVSRTAIAQAKAVLHV